MWVPNETYDPDTGVTEKQEIYCLHRATNPPKSESDAYVLAGYNWHYARAIPSKGIKKGDPWPDSYIWTEAHNIEAAFFVLRDGSKYYNVKARIKALQKQFALEAGFTTAETNRDIRIIKDSDYGRTLELLGGIWVYKFVPEMDENVRKAIKKFKLGADGRPTDIEFWDKPGAIMKVVDILGMVTQRIEISRDDDERLAFIAAALAENGIPEDQTEKILDSYLRLMSKD